MGNSYHVPVMPSLEEPLTTLVAVVRGEAMTPSFGYAKARTSR